MPQHAHRGRRATSSPIGSMRPPALEVAVRIREFDLPIEHAQTGWPQNGIPTFCRSFTRLKAT
jgi:hypothetical protein